MEAAGAGITIFSIVAPLSAMSGWVVVVDALSDTLMWPLSKTMCRPDQKMTTYKGCADKSVVPTGPGGYLFAMVCCMLSLCAAWWFVDPMVASLLSTSSCVLSLIVGFQTKR